MKFLKKRFIKAVLEEDFVWLDAVSKELGNHLTVEHTKPFDDMRKEVVDFIDGKTDKLSEETIQFSSAFLVYDAKYLKKISTKIGPRPAVWILSRALLLSRKPAWDVLLEFEKKLRSS